MKVVTQEAIGEYVHHILGIFLEGFYKKRIISWGFENFLAINSSIVNVIITTFFKFDNISHEARIDYRFADQMVIFLFFGVVFLLTIT